MAIMIPEPKGREIAALLERNVAVTLHITIGTRNLQKYVSRTSVVFVSISFIVLMIISLAWLVFYYIQRFRYANARDRNQVRPCALLPELCTAMALAPEGGGCRSLRPRGLNEPDSRPRRGSASSVETLAFVVNGSLWLSRRPRLLREEPVP